MCFITCKAGAQREGDAAMWSLSLILPCVVSVGYIALEANAKSSETSKTAESGGTFLGSLLGPQPGANSFAKDYWQKMPAVIRRHAPKFYSDFISADDIHAILTDGVSLYNETSSVPQHGTDWKLVRRMKGADGEWWSSTPTEKALAQAPAAEVARMAFSKGFSVVINNLEQRWEPLSNTATTFEKELGYRCGINMYFSPPQAQGFEAHFDWMDVFVLQVQGQKHWKLYDALLMLPRPDLKFKPQTSQIGEPFAEFTLEQGDLLYLPAGVIHEAHTMGLSEGSLHVSMGVESTMVGSWESLLLHLVALGTQASDDVAKIVCSKKGGRRSLSAVLSAEVPGLKAGEEGVLWGDLLTAVIVYAAAYDMRLRSAVPMTELTLQHEPDKIALSGLRRTAKALLSVDGLLAEALGDLRQRNGTLPRSPPTPQVIAGFRRIERFVRESRQTGKVDTTVSYPISPDVEANFQVVVSEVVAVLKSAAEGRKVLDVFGQAMRKDLDDRQADRKRNLGRCRYKKAEYFVIGGHEAEAL